MNDHGAWRLIDYYRLLRADRAYFDSLVDGWKYEAERFDRGTFGPVTMQGWGLGYLGDWSWQIHKFEAIDWAEQFHTHQANWGFRYILCGGYIEEVLQADGSIRHVAWERGDWGIIRAKYNHRFIRLLDNRPAYTLWLRGPTSNDVTWTFPDGRTTIVKETE